MRIEEVVGAMTRMIINLAAGRDESIVMKDIGMIPTGMISIARRDIGKIDTEVIDIGKIDTEVIDTGKIDTAVIDIGRTGMRTVAVAGGTTGTTQNSEQ